MALDTRLPLVPGQMESPLLALGRGIGAGQQMAATSQAMQARKQAMTQADAEQMRNGLLSVYKAMKTLPQEQRDDYKIRAAQQFKTRFGVELPADEVASFPTDDASIDAEIASLSPVVSKTAAIQEFETLTRSAGLQPGTDAYRNAARIHLGVDPRAGSVSAQERIAGDVGLTGKVASSQAQIGAAEAGAKEQAIQNVRAATVPNLEAAITERVEQVKRDSARIQEFDKKVSGAKDVISILDIAEPLIDESTESLAGVGIDAVGRVFGLSTRGAEAAAQLKLLEGSLVLNMPRMEGPQSNMDQQLYRQMAAQIGDATTPAEVRKAATKVLRQLNEKYTKGDVQPPSTTSANPPNVNSKGWGLMIDAKGNKAYVGPNGEIEEVR